MNLNKTEKMLFQWNFIKFVICSEDGTFIWNLSLKKIWMGKLEGLFWCEKNKSSILNWNYLSIWFLTKIDILCCIYFKKQISDDLKKWKQWFYLGNNCCIIMFSQVLTFFQYKRSAFKLSYNPAFSSHWVSH